MPDITHTLPDGRVALIREDGSTTYINPDGSTSDESSSLDMGSLDAQNPSESLAGRASRSVMSAAALPLRIPGKSIMQGEGSFSEVAKSLIPMSSVGPALREADKNYPAENLLPPVGAAVGGSLAQRIPIPYSGTMGAAAGGTIGEFGRQGVRALRGKENPETIGGKVMEAVSEGGKQGAYYLAGNGVIKALKTLGETFPKIVMNKVIGMGGKPLQAEQLGEEAEKIGIKAANEFGNIGKSSKGILDRVQTNLETVGKKIEKTISEFADKNKKTVDVGEFFSDATKNLREKLSVNPENEAALNTIEELRNKYLRKYGESETRGKMSLIELNNLKKSLYNDISDSAWWKSLESNPDKVKTTLSLARAARKIISDTIPGISELNGQYGLYSTMKPFLLKESAKADAGFWAGLIEPLYEKGLTTAAIPARMAGRAGQFAAPVLAPAIRGGALAGGNFLIPRSDENR